LKKATTNPASTTSRYVHHPLVERAFDLIDAAAERVTQEHIAICEIPAPPFGEQARAAYFERRFLELGLGAAHQDAAGNVIGVRPGRSARPTVVVSAHLDTVFPSHVDTRVRRRNGRLYAPGIGDNACGLVALLALIDVLQRTGAPTAGTLVFLGTVGEEGEGNLRGVRHFFADRQWAGNVDAFVSFDGHGVERIVHQALGSRRYRVTFTGPGGHSWGDFGLVNPVHALSRVVTQLVEYALPMRPRASLNVGRISGGQSVNAIPQSATMDVDARSTSRDELERIEAFLESAVESAARRENLRCATTGTRLETMIEPLGERPTGQTPLDADIVHATVRATRALGVEPIFECASTDSNVPISLGIPAVTIGGGGNAGQPHTLDEWYDPSHREVGMKRALLLVVELAGLET
jgi:acetylornithine deacetylase/succinyl-diaminopimelate desuccinylase-like protein